jgi:hypothetical protein
VLAYCPGLVCGWCDPRIAKLSSGLDRLAGVRCLAGRDVLREQLVAEEGEHCVRAAMAMIRIEMAASTRYCSARYPAGLVSWSQRMAALATADQLNAKDQVPGVKGESGRLAAP